MKPIDLKMSAIGPFADCQTLSFENLQDLFLITGDTGAGKTTIFDAITFALFGEASGSTRTTNAMKSDFSKPNDIPYVQFTFEHKCETYYIERTADYYKEKIVKGETRRIEQKSKVEIKNLTNPSSVSGIKEVKNFIVDLLGVNAEQFKQIAMIAQGEFTKLIFAKSTERSEIFRRIFNTEIYSKIENVLREQERFASDNFNNCKRSISQHFSSLIIGHQQSEQLSSMIESYSDIKKFGNISEGIKLVEKLIENDTESLKLLHNSLESLSIPKKSEQLTRAEYNNQSLDNLQKSKTNQQLLLEQKQEIDMLESKIALCEKAIMSVKPLQDLYLNAQKTVEKSEVRSQKLSKEIETISIENTQKQAEFEVQKQLLPQQQELMLSINRLSLTIPKYQQLTELNTYVQTITKKISVCDKQIINLAPTDDTQIIQECELLKNCAVEFEQCKNSITLEANELETVKKQHDLLSLINKTKLELLKRQTEYETVETDFSDCQQAFVKLETSFFREQAGLLSQTLIHGEPCPVCGSIEHPCKAELSDDAPSEQMLNAMRDRLEKKRAEREKQSKLCEKTKTQFESQTAQLNSSSEIVPDIQSVKKLIAVHTENLSKLNISKIDLEKKLRHYSDLQKVLEQTQLENKQKILEIEQIKVNKLDLSSKLSAKQGEFSTIQSQLEYQSIDDLQTQIDKFNSKYTVLKKAYELADKQFKDSSAAQQSLSAQFAELAVQLENARKTSVTAQQNYNQALLDFGNEQTYNAAICTLSELDNMKKTVSDYCLAVLKNKSDIESLTETVKDKPFVDTETLKIEINELNKQQSIITQEIIDLTSKLTSNNHNFSQIISSEKLYTKLENEYSMVSTLARTAVGDFKGVQKLAFERYVQVAYFNLILSRANNYMYKMSSGRYELIRSHVAANEKSQTGLDIDVRDNNNGRIRAITTLSGGESFNAALSLSLGLSDIISEFAGGVQIDALFVDEGFGSLDENAVRHAIHSLAGLTTGNHMVGIISHVSQLKASINTQVIVSKSSNGSSISVSK